MTRLTDLTAQTAANIADSDIVETVDVSDTTMAATGTNKKLTVTDLAEGVGAGGRLVLGIASPSAPSSGVRLFSKSRARTLPCYMGPTGLDSRLQPFFGGNAVSFVRPTGNGTVVTAVGIALTVNGSAGAAANFATTNILTQTKRISYNSAATAGTAGGAREAVAKYWRGSAAGLGGFHFCARFGFNAIPATRRWFVGLSGTAALLANADPSTFLNQVGVGQDLGDTTIQFMHNDGAGASVKSNSTIASPAVGELLEVNVFCAPNSTSIFMSVEKINVTGALASLTTPSTDIPANTVALAPHLWCNNGTTAAIYGLDLVSLYIETDN